MLAAHDRFWDHWYDRYKYKEERMQALIRCWEEQQLMIPGRRCRGYPWAYVTVIVYERDGKACTNCGETDWEKLEIHHIIPLTAGGNSMPENLKLLCVTCHDVEHSGPGGKYHRLKAARDPAQMKLAHSDNIVMEL